MSDDDGDAENNVVKFPYDITLQPPKSTLEETEHQSAHALTVKSIKEITDLIEENEKIVGTVVLCFEEDGSMHDWMAGSLTISNVYLQLDRIKRDLIKTVEGEMSF